MIRIGLLTLLGAVAGGALGACFVSEPKIEVIDEDAGGTGTLPPQPTSPAPASSAGACESDRAPSARDRPDDAPSDREDLPAIHLAWSSITLSDPVGFDLDGACTRAPSCADANEASCRSRPSSVADEDRCRDNTFARLVALVDDPSGAQSLPGWNEERLKCALWLGSTSLVLRIRDYSGGPSDPRVRVDYYFTDGTEEPRGFDCPPGMERERRNYPRWLTSQRWRIDRASLDGDVTTGGELPDSRAFDDDAFVKDGRLIAEWPDGVNLRFAGEPAFSLRVRGTVLRARLERQRDDTWSLRDGVLAGRARREDILESVRASGVCEDDTRYPDIESFVSENLDLIADGDNDAARACDAMSFAFGFTADAMTPGVATDVEQSNACGAPGSCGDGVVSNEHCDTAIDLGKPGACPTTCETEDACTPRRLEGSGCSARCTPQPSPRAGAADGCCPPGAGPTSDPDCGALCGNGVLEAAERCDTAIAAGRTGACPTACTASNPCRPQMLAGRGCEQQCLELPITLPHAGDGCCPPGADATNDPECEARCGNGAIEDGETCDPPGSCGACAALTCFDVRMTGRPESCDVRCGYEAITSCMGGDRCCPAGCSAGNDSDCSATCGNRVIDTGELCENGTSTPCPASCDDQNACTIDLRSGGPETCSVRCFHSAIVEAMNGDGCCPPGASANADSDCAPKCGNRTVEGDEQCDDGNATSGDGCDGCRSESDGAVCLMQPVRDDDCARCTCAKCEREALACYAPVDAMQGQLCRELVECGITEKCGAPDCYCGTMSLFACFSGAGNGPCKNETERAAMTTSLLEIEQRAADLNYPLGLGNALFTCIGRMCAEECDSGID